MVIHVTTTITFKLVKTIYIYINAKILDSFIYPRYSNIQLYDNHQIHRYQRSKKYILYCYDYDQNDSVVVYGQRIDAREGGMYLTVDVESVSLL